MREALSRATAHPLEDPPPADAEGRRARSWRDALAKQILHEPLFDTFSSLAGLGRMAPWRRPRTVFVGIGLCARDLLSRAVPLDLLGMLLPAELVRRATGAEELLVLVADRHALENGFPAAEVRRRTLATEAVLHRAGAVCGLPALRVLRASSFHQTAGYRSALAHVRRRADPRRHDYVLRQFADLVHLGREHGPLVKIGWCLSKTGAAGKHDELALDQALSAEVGAELGFLYCKPARTLSDASPRMPPYVVRRPEARLCLDRGEDPVAKLLRARRSASPATVAGFRRHLRHLLYTYCRVVGPLPRGPIEERAASLVERLHVEPPLD